MPASFLPRLISKPFQDPGLYVPFSFIKRAIFFDLGDISHLSPKDILKASHVFISHTHMDHFIGFDHLLRLVLGRAKKLCLYGPEGFIQNLEGKLSGYSWDLVENYENILTLEATEIHQTHLLVQTYICRNRFQPTAPPLKKTFTDLILDEPGFSVSTIILDHSIPCLGFVMKERFQINIKKAELQDHGITVGPWLNDLKQALFDNKPADSIFEIPVSQASPHGRCFKLGELSSRIAKITPGQKIGYITDVRYTPENLKKIIPFVQGVDHLFIEAAFSDAHADIAFTKNHLTARQAGEICGKAGAKRFTIFHFSPRYSKTEMLLYKEAEDAYQKAFSNATQPGHFHMKNE
jgi:ribonuclease Z